MLIKYKINLSDGETIQAISENPYMLYMPGNVMKFLRELIHASFEKLYYWLHSVQVQRGFEIFAQNPLTVCISTRR